MGYHDDSVVKVDKEFLQPFDSGEIQMVGRLVKKQDIRISEQGLCKKNLYLHTTCKIGHFSIMEFCVNSKAIEKSSSIGFCFPSIHFGKLALQFTGTDSILICEILFCIDGFFFFHNLIETKVTHDNGIQNSVGIIFEMILL